jgi:hypothetical protein
VSDPADAQNTGRSSGLRPAWKPGQSGNPGGRPKSKVLRAMLEPHRRSMVATLLVLMRSADKDATRLEAVKVMLAYLDGKPDEIGPTDLTDSELLAEVNRRVPQEAKS